MAILVLYVHYLINGFTTTVGSLAEAESHCQQKAVPEVYQSSSVPWSNSAPLWMIRTQMWSDLVGAGVISLRLTESQTCIY